MSFEPTDEMRAAYKLYRESRSNGYIRLRSVVASLADLALYAMAAAIEAEHNLYQHYRCPNCGNTEADWLKLADEKLREVAKAKK
jgi:poly-gamma-glutamate capsule biosynthesis protein CapA/YwtB (metallophosphatase superfamily)